MCVLALFTLSCHVWNPWLRIQGLYISGRFRRCGRCLYNISLQPLESLFNTNGFTIHDNDLPPSAPSSATGDLRHIPYIWGYGKNSQASSSSTKHATGGQVVIGALRRLEITIFVARGKQPGFDPGSDPRASFLPTSFFLSFFISLCPPRRQ